MPVFASIPRPEVAPASRMSPRCVLLSRMRHAGVAEKSTGEVPPEASSPIPSSVPRVGFRKRSVSSVSSVVASGKRPLRPVASASGPVAPKSVLQGPLSKFKRAALRNKSKRILERLATLRPGTPSGSTSSRRILAWDCSASFEFPAEAGLGRARQLRS